MGRRALGAVAACAALLAGCGDGDAKMLQAGGTTVLVSGEADMGFLANGGGRLEIVGGCLGANGDVVIWPHGTKVVDEDPLTVEVPGSGRVALGENVGLAGGWVLEHLPDDAPAEARVGRTFDPDQPFRIGDVTVPPSCVEHDVFLAYA